MTYTPAERPFAQKPLTVFEIEQPVCSRVFGEGLCEATGEPCFNTDATCKFRDALDLSEVLLLRFVEEAAHEVVEDAGAYQPRNAIPSLRKIDVTPNELNVSGGSANSRPLGTRGVANIGLMDHPYNDVLVDPYLSQRSYDPNTQGTFWGKWLARNPFHVGYKSTLYSGFRGQALSEMTPLKHQIEKINIGTNYVTVNTKDAIRTITSTGATAPELSPGYLSADIDDSVVVFEVSGATLDDYFDSGYLRIGSEVVSYTDAELTVGENVQFNGVVRGIEGTETSSHSQFDRVQKCLRWENEPYQNIMYELCTEYGAIDPAIINKDDWDEEQETWRSLYLFTGWVTAPTKVGELLGELCQSSLSNLWMDERAGEVLMKAQRPDYFPVTLSTASDILPGSLKITEKPEERASRVYLYYAPKTPVADLTDSTNYARGEVYISVLSEGQYGGDPAIREIYSRFIPTALLASAVAATYSGRFKDVRRSITFEMNKDSELWTGSTANISAPIKQDFYGSHAVNNWLITSAEMVTNGSLYRYKAEDNDSAGVLWEWQGDDLPATWDLASAAQRVTVPYWTDDSGNDADGTAQPWKWM